jgi:hypothetical protein
MRRIKNVCHFARPAGLKQEPRAPLRLVYPVLDQACACHIPVLIAQTMGLAQVGRQLLLVVAQLGRASRRLNSQECFTGLIIGSLLVAR